MTPIDLEALRGHTPGPHPVAKANHGSDHYTIGDGPPFVGVARKEADAQLFAVADAMHAELTTRRARDAEANKAIAMALQHIRLCAPSEVVESTLESTLAPFTGATT